MCCLIKMTTIVYQNIQYVKGIDTRLTSEISNLSQNTNNQVFREILEHFYDSREVSSLNLTSQYTVLS